MEHEFENLKKDKESVIDPRKRSINDLGNNHVSCNDTENKCENDSELNSSKDDGKVSCLGRVTWLGGRETEIESNENTGNDSDGDNDYSEEEDDDDNDDEENENVLEKKRNKEKSEKNDSNDDDDNDDNDDDDASSSTETIVRKQSKWGWLVVLGSMIIHMVADGISFSFGVLLYSLVDIFDVTKSDVALVGSILGGLPLFFGPICSYLVNRFSCRTVTVAGGLLTAIGFFLSSFVQKFNLFYITMSLISGIGLSLVYVPAVVIVAYYFEEKRSWATGLAVSGTGIGYALFAPAIDYLLEKLKWQNTLRVLAACFLIISLCGLLFRPIEFQFEKKPNKKKKIKNDTSDCNKDDDEKLKLKELKKRRKARKKLRKKILKDSRLPSPMSSIEKLERFIHHMEQAEIEEEEIAAADKINLIETKCISNNSDTHMIYINEDEENKNKIRDNDANNFNKSLDVLLFCKHSTGSKLMKSFSIAALPSFYLNYDNDVVKNANEKSCVNPNKPLLKDDNQDQKKSNEILVASKSSKDVKNESLCVENFQVQKTNDNKNFFSYDLLVHGQLKEALKRPGINHNLTETNKSNENKLIHKHHIETGNLSIMIDQVKQILVKDENVEVNNGQNYPRNSSKQITLFDEKSLKNNRINDFEENEDGSYEMSIEAVSTKNLSSASQKVTRKNILKKEKIIKQNDCAVKGTKNNDKIKTNLNLSTSKPQQNSQLREQPHILTKQDLLRAYNLPLCRKDIFYRGSIVNLRRMLLKTLPEKLNKLNYYNSYNINNSSNLNILYSNNPSIIGNQSLTNSCPNLYLRYPYDISSFTSSSSSSSSSSSDASSLSSFLTDAEQSNNDKKKKFKNKSTKKKCHIKNKFLNATIKLIKHLFPISIIKNPTFLLFGISNFIFYMWHEIPMMFIRDYADECKCMKNYEIWFIFISCGIANAIGQWIYGYLGDCEKINEKILYAVSTIVCGITVLTIPFVLNHLALMITDQILFGVFLSANYVLNSIILVEILGVDKLTDAYGLLLLLQGFALVIGSPLAGKILNI